MVIKTKRTNRGVEGMKPQDYDPCESLRDELQKYKDDNKILTKRNANLFIENKKYKQFVDSVREKHEYYKSNQGYPVLAPTRVYVNATELESIFAQLIEELKE